MFRINRQKAEEEQQKMKMLKRRIQAVESLKSSIAANKVINFTHLFSFSLHPTSKVRTYLENEDILAGLHNSTGLFEG